MLIQPPLYKYTQEKRNKMVARTYWPLLVEYFFIPNLPAPFKIFLVLKISDLSDSRRFLKLSVRGGILYLRINCWNEKHRSQKIIRKIDMDHGCKVWREVFHFQTLFLRRISIYLPRFIQKQNSANHVQIMVININEVDSKHGISHCTKRNWNRGVM